MEKVRTMTHNLIFKKMNDRWIIQTESDKATDTYFERLRKKEIK